MKTDDYETTIELDVVVRYRYTPGEPAHIPSRNRPEDYDPGSEPDVEVVDIQTANGGVEIPMKDVRGDIEHDIAREIIEHLIEEGIG